MLINTINIMHTKKQKGGKSTRMRLQGLLSKLKPGRKPLEALSEKELKYELKKKRSLFLSFPYLSNEINKKIEDLNYSSQVQECY